MGQIKFNLRDPKSENKTSIILVFYFDLTKQSPLFDGFKPQQILKLCIQFKRY